MPQIIITLKVMQRFLFIAFFLPVFSWAQSNYKPGYVVKLQGDTLRGFINYKEWDKNPKTIQFKKGPDNTDVETFSAKEIAAFSISDIAQYQRFILPISLDQVDINKLAIKLDTTTITDTVFLKVCTKGFHLTMYAYTDDIKPRYYLLENGDTHPQELIYHAWYNISESAAIHYVTRYQGQLTYFKQKYKVNSDKLDEQILESRYVEPQLVKIIQIINGPSSQQFTPKSVFGSRWFLGIGVNYSNLKFTETLVDALNGSHLANSSCAYPKITAGIDFFPDKNVQSLILRFELTSTINQYSLLFNNNTTVAPSTSTLNFTQYNNSLVPQLIYNIVNSEKIKFFVGAGVALNFSLYNQYAYITKYDGSFPDNVQRNFPAFDNFWISFPIKTGVFIGKKIEINLSYVPSASITGSSTSPSGNVTAYQAGVNYLFGSK